MCAVLGIELKCKIFHFQKKMLKVCAIFSLRLILLVLSGAAVLLFPTLEPDYHIELQCRDDSVKYNVGIGAFAWHWDMDFGACWGGDGHLERGKRIRFSSIHFWGFKISYLISVIATIVTIVALAMNLNVKIMQMAGSLQMVLILTLEIVPFAIQFTSQEFSPGYLQPSRKMLAYILIKNVCYFIVNVAVWIPVKFG